MCLEMMNGPAVVVVYAGGSVRFSFRSVPVLCCFRCSFSVLVLLPSHFFLYLTALYSDICIPQGTDANVMRLGEGYDYGIDIWALGRQRHRLSCVLRARS